MKRLRGFAIFVNARFRLDTYVMACVLLTFVIDKLMCYREF